MIERGRVVAATGAVVFALLALVGGQRLVYSGKILPGTEMAGVSLGGASEQEARTRLAAISTQDRAMTFSHGGRLLRIRGRRIGFRIDVAESVSRAMRAGRRGPLAGIGSTVTAMIVPRSVTPIYTARRRALARVVKELASQVDQPSFPGRLDIDPGTLGVDVVAPVRGRVLNQRATAAAIISGLRRHDEAATALPVKTAPGVDQAEVQAVGRQARVYLRKPLRLAGARRPLVVPPRRLAGVLDLEFADSRGATAVRLGVQSRPLAALVDRLAARTDRVAENAGVTTSTPALTVEEKLDLSWRPRPATVQVQRARHGRRLRRSAAAEAITEAVREGRHTASLPVQAARPEVTTAAARRVRSLLATFTTRFECCQPRVTNIQTMARTVDNSVVSVGRQFSLNRIVGPRTRAKGYLPAPFIADGKIIPSVGGGVSQFSTTMYNAAYLAGLQLDFHQPHSFYIDRYPPGREATLDYPSIDLTWTNDTDAPVVVRSSSTDTSITISLYGESGGRRVRAQSGPRQRPPGRDFALTVTRSIRYRGGRVVRQPYTTTYDRPPETE